MSATRTIDATAHIANVPETVIAYIADVRNRPLFIRNLRSVSDVQGAPGQVGGTWRWTFSVLGFDFEGAGRVTGYEPGRRFSFDTDGGVQSHWTYTAEPEGEGTRLSLRIEYSVPPGVVLPAEEALAAARRSETDAAIRNLKTILDT